MAKRRHFAEEWASERVHVLRLVTFSDEHQVSTNDFTCRTMWVLDKSDILYRERKREQNCVRVHGRLFLQDNARIHTAKRTVQKLSDMGWRIVDGFPPYSPDLNPIERVWAVMNRRVAELHPTTLEQLTTATVNVWNAMSQGEVDSFCSTWRKDLQRCCLRRGRP
jgi:transposase